MKLIACPVGDTAFLEADKLWLITSDGEELLRTADGGESWESTRVARFKSITFCDSANGWAVDEEANIWRSRDSGRSWSRIARLEHDDPLFLQNQIRFVDQLHGWVLDIFSVWRTEDGGFSWQRNPVQSNPADFKEIVQSHFIKPGTGWVWGFGNSLYTTHDGGNTWRPQELPSNVGVTAVYFIDEQTGWIVSSDESAMSEEGTAIYRTDDGGERWHLQSQIPRTVISSVQFTNVNEGWGLSEVTTGGETTPYKSHSVILHTQNGGKNWENVQLVLTESSCSSMHFASASHGWVIAWGDVYRTSDAGISWQTVLRLPKVEKGDGN